MTHHAKGDAGRFAASYARIALQIGSAMIAEQKRLDPHSWKLLGNSAPMTLWGNAKDGFEVNDTRSAGEVSIRCRVEVNNAGTPQEFLSAYPSDSSDSHAALISCADVKLEIQTEMTLTIYVNRAKDGYPLGEMYCTFARIIESNSRASRQV